MESWKRDVMQGVLASVPPSTLRSYTKAWSNFLTFRGQSLSIAHRVSPTTDQVLQYLVHLHNLGQAAKTLRIQPASISFFTKSIYFTDPCAKFVVCRALEGWHRLQPPSKEGHWPISFDLLSNIHRKLKSVCCFSYESHLFSAAYSIAYLEP